MQIVIMSSPQNIDLCQYWGGGGIKKVAAVLLQVKILIILDALLTPKDSFLFEISVTVPVIY